MAEIINLRTWKKRAERAAGKAEADGNAARFGRSKALKKLEQARADRERTMLEAHRRGGGSEDTGPGRDGGEAPASR